MLDDYRGLYERSPWLALALAYFMLSLTGVPPTGGFSAKFFVFGSAIDAGLLWLAIVGVITSVISGYFYLRLVYLSFMVSGEGEPIHPRAAVNLAVAVAVVATILLGLLPGPLFEMAQQAVFAGGRILAGG